MADPVTGAVMGGLGLVNAITGSKTAKRQERAAVQAADKQAQAMTEASDKSTALQREMFNKQMEVFTPFLEAGAGALPYLQEYLTKQPERFEFKAQDYTQTPEYQQIAQQAEQAVMRNQAATGGMRSGGAQAALAGISPQILQQLRNEDYQRQLQQYSVNQGAQTDAYNRLMGIAGLGFGGAQQTGSAAGQFGSAAGQNAMMTGQALSNQAANVGNARINRLGQQQGLLSGLLSDAGSFYMGGF
jgi:hypothetical protein